MKFRRYLLPAVGLMLMGGIAAAFAAGISTNGLPAAVFPLTGSETIAADTNLAGGAAPQSEAVTLNQINRFASAPFALTDAASITTDASLGRMFTVTLAGNRTLNTPTNLQAGAGYQWVVTQDASGSRTLNYGGAFTWTAGSAPTVTATASKSSLIRCWADTAARLLCDSVLNF